MDLQLISRLQYPFQPRLSPHANFIESKMQQWIDEYACSPEPLLNRYKRSSFGYLASFMYPQASLERLILISRFIHWAFAHDDFFGPWPPEELPQITREAVTILEGGPVTRDNGAMRELKVNCNEIAPYATPAWQKRFVMNMADYLSSLEDERRYNFNSIIQYPSLEDFIAIRVRTTVAFALIDLIEIATDTVLPPSVLNDPAIQRLVVLANRLTGWSNDCLSLPRELGLERTNLVLVIRNERKCTLEEALNAAIQLHDNDIQEFMALRSSLPYFGAWQSAVEDYVQGLEWFIAGHVQWYHYTKRYEETSAERVI